MSKDAIARVRIEALALRLTEQMASQDRANRIALEAAEKAVIKAETASEKRFEGVNEFRQTLSDQAANFVTRKEVEALLANVNGTLSRLDKHDAASTGRALGADRLWLFIVGAVGLLISAAVYFRG